MREELRKTLETLLILLILAVGFYPAVSGAWNQMAADRMIVQYRQSVWSDGSDGTSRAELEKARAYNQQLATAGGGMAVGAAGEEYGALLDPDGNGIMGYLEIPKISVCLPIAHGTDDEVLEGEIGHLPGSSLPVGGEGTHAVLTGHRGLPSARLFTDLDQLEEKDRFRITVLGEELNYEVREIQTVLPEETQNLRIRQGEDLVTLVTCTPYGVNTHRLLVTGERVHEEVFGKLEDGSDHSKQGGTSEGKRRQEKTDGESEDEELRTAEKNEREKGNGLYGILPTRNPSLVLALAGLILIAAVLRILWIWMIDRERGKRRRSRCRRI